MNLPKNEMPGIMMGLSPKLDISTNVGFKAATGGEDFSVAAKLFGGSYLRMVAKIAHCYASGALGVGNFSPCLVSTIIGKGPSKFSYFIGTVGNHVPQPYLHCVELFETWLQAGSGLFGRFYVIRLRLFANMGTPVYTIVVGSSLKYSSLKAI